MRKSKLLLLSCTMGALGAAWGAAWSNAGRGAWATASNWAEKAVPDASALATNNVGGTTLVGASDNIKVRAFFLGNVGGASGSLEMSGGLVEFTDEVGFRLGDGTTGHGTATMTGGEMKVRQAQIGANGPGEMTISGGRMTIADYSCIGRYVNGKGKMTITGTGEAYCTSAEHATLFIGEEGDGELVIENGGKLAYAPENKLPFKVPNNNSGRGKVRLGTGGTLTVNEIVVANGGSSFTLDGGTIVAKGDSSKTNFLGNRGKFYITDNGGTIDTGAYERNVWIGLDAAEGAVGGMIVKTGAGKLKINYSGTYRGGYDVREGSLELPGPFMLAGYATAPMSFASGTKLILGKAWSDEQVLALTNRATFVRGEGVTVDRAAYDPDADEELFAENGYTITVAAGTVFTRRLKKTGAGTLVIAGACEFRKGVYVAAGILEADYERSGLNQTHLVLEGKDSGNPVFFRQLAPTLTATPGKSGNTIELNTFCGILPGAGPLEVNFYGDGRMLKIGADGVAFTDLILGDRADWPVHLKNGLDLNGVSKTLKTQNGGLLYMDGGLTNSSSSAGNLWSWDGNLVFGDVPGRDVDVFSYRINPRSGSLLFTNAVVCTLNDFSVGDSSSPKTTVVTFKDSSKSSSGGWDYINGSTGTCVVVDGGSYMAPYRMNIGWKDAGKTGTLVLTNEAQVSISDLRMQNGRVDIRSGKLTLGSSQIGATNGTTLAGLGLATLYVRGGELFGKSGANVQMGSWNDALVWMTSGKIDVASYPSVGRYAGSHGELRIHGGSYLHRKNDDNDRNLVFIGEEGSGFLSIANGGRFESAVGFGVQVGNAATSEGTVMLSPDGTAVVSQLAFGGNAKNNGFVFNGGTLVARTHVYPDKLIDNPKRQVVTPYGGAIDTNGQGDFTVGKAFSKATEVKDLAETIFRRWSFKDGSLVDSVGGATAMVTGDNVACGDGVLHLKGGANGTGCVNLGTNLLPTDGRGVTIEVWFKMNDQKNWIRVFNFGKDNNELYFTPYGPNGGFPQVTINNFASLIGTQKVAVGKVYHVALTVGQTQDDVWEAVYELHDAETGKLVERKTTSKDNKSWRLGQISQVNGCWLGHSSFAADNDPNADYYEVRIHHRVMTADQLAASVAAGARHVYALRKLGANKLTLSGANAYACGTAVEQGSLALAANATLPATEWLVAKNATLELNATPQVAAMLAGEGLVKSGSVTVNGTIQPGGVGTVGTLSFDGTELKGGRLVIDVDAEGNADKLVTSWTLDLSKLSLKLNGVDNLDRKAQYVIVEASGGLTGAFAEVDLPKRWAAEVVGNKVVLSRNNGGLILVVQ